MTPKDFLIKFFLAVALVLAAVYAFTYFEMRQYEKPAEIMETAGVTPAKQEPPADVPATETDQADVPAEAKAKENIYSIEKYPVSHSAGGDLKMIAPDHSAITIVDANGNEIYAIVSESTEVFRNGNREDMTAIQAADQVTILGRKRTEDGTEFVADTIYASTVIDTPVPLDPEE